MSQNCKIGRVYSPEIMVVYVQDSQGKYQQLSGEMLDVHIKKHNSKIDGLYSYFKIYDGIITRL